MFSPSSTARGQNAFNIFKDDFYDKKDISPGFMYNAMYIGNEIRDNSTKPTAPMYSMGRATKDHLKRYKIYVT